MPVVMPKNNQENYEKMRVSYPDLHADVLDFYRQWNGLLIIDEGLELSVPALQKILIDFDAFYQIDSKQKWQDLYFINQEIGDDLPTDVMVIGGDAGGNFFVMHPQTSKMYYWDRTLLHAVDYPLAFKSDIGNVYEMQIGFRQFVELILQQAKQSQMLINNE